ncbi:DnaJ-domain-containing protein, partial [Phellopilus nigrolimitatus]
VPVDTELYELLEVPPTASDADVKKAYRKKAKEHHPDKNINDPEASKRFQEIGAAYEILSDPQTREVYDEYGLEGIAGGQGGPGGGVDPADIFAELFGGGGRGGGGGFSFAFGGPGGMGGGPRRSRQQDSIIPYEVTLEDLYNGKHVKMNMEKEIVCAVCRGSGAKSGAKPKPCIKCEGKGWTTSTTPIGHSSFGQARVVCEECEGVGEKLREKDRCKKCKAKKTVKEKKRQEIFVEKGMTDRQRIVLTGEGDQSASLPDPDVPAGDVIFVLKLERHSAFERSGNDLSTKVQITLSEALLGFDRILLTHLDGRGIQVASTAGKVIRPNDTMILRGEGMPHYKSPDRKGDLYVVFDVEFPDEGWAKSVDKTALYPLLPPKKPDLEPRPAVVDTPAYEEGDFVDVRARSFPAGADFLNQSAFSSFQFGADEDAEEAWTDEDDEGEGEPECRTQ